MSSLTFVSWLKFDESRSITYQFMAIEPLWNLADFLVCYSIHSQ
jgi:hypothetical protein